MPLEIVQQRRLYRQVAEQLRVLIERGEFAAGARLPSERELAIHLGISRPTVREALIALEVEGFIRIKVGSGIYVEPRQTRRHSFDTRDVPGPFDILSARALIEGAVAEEAARAARPADVRRLDAALDAMRRTSHPGMESMARDRAFHLAIAQITGNETVAHVVGELFDRRINPYFAQLASYFENAESWENALTEHTAIRDAIAKRDPAAALRAMRRHLESSQARFAISFDEEKREPSPRAAPATAVPKKAMRRRK